MKKFLLVALAASACVLADVRPAEACGGCFSPPTERTVVTDHRMALSISTNQTVLWDQIQYSGEPSEFAWVLPVRQGATIELANDEFIGALDSSTQPVVTGPNQFGGGVGCGLTGCASNESASAMGDGANGNVQVISQSVIGPYETVTLRATDEDALTKWLTTHDYTIPPAIEPTIKAYVDEKFDFIALRLRPQCNERAMRPVRVVTQGADPTLPLRMVAAGVGARVGITLYVISEGRYEPQNFPVELIDDDNLRWDRVQNKSNYEAISQEIMGHANGRTWLLENASPAYLIDGIYSGYQYNAGRQGGQQNVADLYFQRCASTGYYPASSSSSSSSGSSGQVPFTPCPQGPTVNDAGNQNQNQAKDASSDAQSNVDGGAGADAGDGGIGDGEDGEDAGTSPPQDAGSSGGYDAGTTATPSNRSAIAPSSCKTLDDLDVALYGLHRRDVWVTRLRAVLPIDALQSGDLRLQPSKKQVAVSNLHNAIYYTDEDSPGSARDGCGSAPKEHRAYGSWVLGFLSTIFAVALVRRRRRPRD